MNLDKQAIGDIILPFIIGHTFGMEESEREIDVPFLPRDKFRNDAIKLDGELAEVFGRKYPKFMDIQRPGQTDSQNAYRKDLFEKLGNPISIVEGMIERQTDKVFTSDGFHLKFKTDERGSDTFQKYITTGYWNGVNFIDSFKQAIKKKINIAPNSLLAVLPNESKSSELPKPYFAVIPAKNILYYKANTMAIFKSELKQPFDDKYLREPNVVDPLYRREEGDIWYVFTDKKYCRMAHVGYDAEGRAMFDSNTVGDNLVNHGCPYMPVVKIGRKLKDFSEDGSELRSSDISDGLCALQNALQNYLDHSVELNFHSASQEYVVGVTKCKTCRGKGKITDSEDPTKKKNCDKCQNGWVSPFSGSGLDRVLIPPMVEDEVPGTTNMIDPKKMMGFFERPTHGEKSFKENFLDNVSLAIKPLGIGHILSAVYNQSGDAKDKDMSEGYAYCQSIAQHVGNLLKFTIESMAWMRYKTKNDDDFVRKIIPNITIPNSFSLEGYATLLKRLTDASQYSLPSFVIDKLEADLIEKEYGVNSLEYRKFNLKKAIDPLPNANHNTKVISRSYLDDESYILTTRFEQILNKSIAKIKDFLFLDLDTQEGLMRSEAKKMLELTRENLDKTVVLKPAVNIVNEDQTN